MNNYSFVFSVFQFNDLTVRISSLWIFEQLIPAVMVILGGIENDVPLFEVLLHPITP